jgi:hypothetical protein
VNAIRWKGAVIESALLEMQVFAWRPRPRVLKASTVREAVDPNLFGGDDPAGLLGLALSLAAWAAITLLAPLIVPMLAATLFFVEVPLLLVLALGLIAARFAGLIPWTVLIVDRFTGKQAASGDLCLRRIGCCLPDTSPDAATRRACRAHPAVVGGVAVKRDAS